MRKQLRRFAAWSEERLGSHSVWGRLVHGTVDPRWAWLRTTGMACLVLVIVEAITGSVLGLYYTPAAASAYKDIVAIEQNPMGHFLRGIHHWGSASLILLSVFTIVRMFFRAEYKGRRDVVWIAAVLFSQFVLIFQVTGHALPWDTNAAATTDVEAGIGGNVWVVGPYIKRFILGGPTLAAASLTRWYALHAMILPLALIGLVALPLAAHRMRSAGRAAGAAAHGDHLPHPSGGREPYLPNHMAREMLVALVVFLVVVAMALVVRTPLELEATADNLAGYKAMSEWYVLPMHAATLVPPFNKPLFEPLVTFVGPGILVTLLLALPFIDRNPERSMGRRKFAMASGSLVLLSLFGLYGFALVVERPIGSVEKVAVGPPGKTNVVVDTALASRGKELYAKEGCNACHSIGGAGGKTGPDLTKVGVLRPDRDWQVKHLVKPDSIVPGSTMPAYGQLKQDELKAIAEYMLSLR